MVKGLVDVGIEFGVTIRLDIILFYSVLKGREKNSCDETERKQGND